MPTCESCRSHMQADAQVVRRCGIARAAGVILSVATVRVMLARPGYTEVRACRRAHCAQAARTLEMNPLPLVVRHAP